MIASFRSLILLVAFATLLRAEDVTNADALWKKTNDAIDALNKQPDPAPQSQEEMIAYFKKLITAADEAAAAFTAQFPHDARRWKIKVFDALTFNVRGQIGLKQHGEMNATLAEVLAAPDADAGSKGQASAITLMFSADSGAVSTEAWVKQAEEHLQKYPDVEFNEQIKGRLAGMKTLAELKSKPLDLKFKAVDGREVDLSQMRGKVVLVDFWATWCGPCVGEVPNVVKTYEKLHPKGFEIVGISLDQDQGKLESFTKDKGMSWPQYFDGKGWKNEISGRFGINSIPAMWLIDKKGIVVTTNARDELEELVEKQLAE